MFLYLSRLVKLKCDLTNLLCAASDHYIYILFSTQILVPSLGAAIDVALCWHSCVFAVVYLPNNCSTYFVMLCSFSSKSSVACESPTT